MLYDVPLSQDKVHLPDSVGTCPTANPPSGQRYNVNNMYTPPYISWIWHAYPYSSVAANTWAEVMHKSDPFGDENYGDWFMYSPGSGIYFDVGVTIAFNEHGDAFQKFGIACDPRVCDYNEELSKAAAATGVDSIQFLAHVDHVNYQCDTHNTGNAGLDYMGLEILAVKLVGKYSCGTPAGAPSSIRTGWQASKPCHCDNKHEFLNCKGVPFRLSSINPDLNASMTTILV
jgi:hypothetical protein